MTSQPKKNSRPIGIFDSGVGGLTVLKALIHAYPEEPFIYLGDTARLPYGTKSPETIKNYVTQNIRFLIARNAKMIVVACNSASSVLPELLNSNSPDFKTVPIFGVIETGAAEAVRVSRSARIGVIGTHATVKGGAYLKAIQSYQPNAQVYQQACPLLVPLVEEGWIEDTVTEQVLDRYLSPLLAHNIDTLILGCTHFPVIRKAIAQRVGPGIALVDSANGISQKLAASVGSTPIETSQSAAKFEILVTDNSESVARIANLILAPAPLPNIYVVNLM